MAIQGMELNHADLSALFKIKYEKLSENVYNSANVLLGRCKKSYNFVGSKMQITIPQSFAGGVGSGTLPKASRALYAAAEITSKKVYAVVQVDRETIKAAMKDEGSFVRATKEVVKKGVESYMRNLSRILFSDGEGIIALAHASTAATYNSTDKELTITLTSGFNEADLEERDLVNIEGVSAGGITGDVTAFEIVEVNASAGTITVSCSSDQSSNVTASGKISIQNSLGVDPMGLKGAVGDKNITTSKSSGGAAGNLSAATDLYSVPLTRKWQSVEKDASSASISTDLLNEVMLAVEKKCGKAPNLIVTSFKQYEKILNILEDQKRYQVNTRSGLKSSSGADISFSGVEFMSSAGPIGIFPERFCDDDRVYFLNDSHIQIYHRPNFGWFDDDGTVFLRMANEDAYEARYGGYFQIYINPCFHGVLQNLA